MEYWIIEGYDSTKLIYETRVPVGCMTEKQLITTLKCLTAKAGLNYNEIVNACVKKRTKTSNLLLDVNRSSPYLQFRCGENPFFLATTKVIP